MDSKYRSFHIITSLIFNLLMLISVFSTDNPVILAGTAIVCLTIFYFSKNMDKLKKGLIYFIPFSSVTIIINLIFVNEGTVVMFYAFGRNFTLEALVYAVILSLKLLIVVYIFMILGIMVDSDKAVSYFSSVMPKATLTFMIAFKLYPTMRDRINNLKEVYSLRGVNFEEKGLKDKVISYIPVFSILLESSLEGAFDIGEAAYVRGFLGGRRTVYDKQRFRKKDSCMLASIMTFACCLIIVNLSGMDVFEIYSGMKNIDFINLGIIAAFAATVQMAVFAALLVEIQV